MTTQAKLPQGTPAWFEMVGGLMAEFATRAELPHDHKVSFVERYTDGTEIGDGLVQGIASTSPTGGPHSGSARDATSALT